MSLSICLITWEPAARVAAALAPLAPYTDEVVIAADSAIDARTLDEYRSLADRLFIVEYVRSERHHAWLFAQCTRDWILRLDGDETPSADFVRRLPELLASRDAHQYWLGRSWLYPDRDHLLADAPWSEDFVNRLTRNDGALHTSGRMHNDPDPVTPRRYIPGALYHLDLLLKSTEQRRQKVDEYDAERPGLLTHDGAPLNRAFYLPELRKALAYDDVPAEDRALIGEALDATAHATGAHEPRASAPEPLQVSLDEMDRHWDGRDVGDGAYQALIEPYRPAVAVAPSGLRPVFVYVTNEGSEPWPARLHDGPSIRLGHRWLNSDETIHGEEGPRSPFLSCVAPGERLLVPVDVLAPAEPGDYLLEIDVVHEYVRWFRCPCRIPVHVAYAPGEGVDG